jgi:hypothetical protein
MVPMKTASIGRRFGDWLGVVPDEEAPSPSVTPTAADVASPGELAARQTEPNSDSVPDRHVRSFRDVVNQRRQSPA